MEPSTPDSFLLLNRQLYESFINGDDPVLGEIPRKEVYTLGFGLAAWIHDIPEHHSATFKQIRAEIDNIVPVKINKDVDIT